MGIVGLKQNRDPLLPFELREVNKLVKSIRWMPWNFGPMKDVVACEKPRGAGKQALIRGYPNGETRLD